MYYINLRRIAQLFKNNNSLYRQAERMDIEKFYTQITKIKVSDKETVILIFRNKVTS